MEIITGADRIYEKGVLLLLQHAFFIDA